MTTPQGRERKYYRLTHDGKKQLETKTREWKLFSEKVNAVLSFSGA
jgi:DNA-binding PadR family transcriptional regulator